jgi:hypothetical protein
MRPISLNSGFSQFVAVMAPIGALLITLLVVYPAWGRYSEVRARVQMQEAELRALKAAPLPPRDPVLPAADQAPGEPSQFLGEMAALAGASQCEITGLDTQQSQSAPSARVQPLRTKITVAGRYPAIRAFLARIQNASRLYVVTELSVRGRAPGTAVDEVGHRVDATIGIERYVAPVQVSTASR